MAAFVEEGMAPGSAYQLTLDSDDDLVWTADTDGRITTFDSDPNLGLWSRLMIAVFGILPVEDYL